jgi:hypothetical protein
MQREAAVALYALLHQDRPYHDGTRQNWSAERSREFPYYFGDGVSIFMSQVDLGLGGDFLEQVDPLADLVAEQPERDESESA